jgi:hypothetical protein
MIGRDEGLVQVLVSILVDRLHGQLSLDTLEALCSVWLVALGLGERL